ncbi:MAG: L,D-transpeptidase family protein [Phycisphaerales bacterium]|nr:L,D-transpeptidase family protein [Phycisphaerales bacterium]
MALPSQTERSSSSSRVSASRSRGMSSKALAGIVAVLMAAGGFAAVWYIKSQPAANPPNSNAGTQTPGTGGPRTGSKPPAIPSNSSPSNSAKLPPNPTSGGSVPLSGSEQAPGTIGGDSPSTPLKTEPSVGSPSGSTTGEAPKNDKPAPVDVSNPSATPGGNTPNATDSRPPAPTTPLPASGSTEEVRSLMSQGDEASQRGQLVQARQFYSRALVNGSTAASDQAALREKISKINDDLFFSPKVTAGDPLAETYVIQSGDAIARLPRKRELAIDWRLLKRINRFSDDDLTRLKVGQKIKLIRGPFHAVVNKADYRLDMYSGSPDDPGNWLYIRSFKVGLGEGNGTPVGGFIIKSRQVNPPWTNPRTGEKFAADDPQNPIGEYWLGWEGVGPSAAYTGFGIHGTIDPDSIGKQKSMGCVRLLNEDVATVYEMLTERISIVQVRP